MGQCMDNIDVMQLQYWTQRAADADAPFNPVDYEAAGVSEIFTQAWWEAGIPPQIASDFEAMDLGPDEAMEWGVIPPVVEEFLALGFDAHWTREWRNAGAFTAVEAAAWRDAGFSIADAQIMCNADRVMTALLLQGALAGLAPVQALRSILLAAGPRSHVD